jgi:phosphoglycerate dehydrogenase-like enzyme
MDIITDEKERLQSIAEADVFLGWLSSDEFKASKKLKWVQSPSAGVESFLTPDFIKSDVELTNAKGCYAAPIAEHVFGLLFGLSRGISTQINNMKEGIWSREGHIVEQRDRTMGIVGFGGIGREVARRAKAMDMKVIAADILPMYTERMGDLADEIVLMQDGGFEYLLSQSDVVVSAAPHTKSSEGIFNADAFTNMKEGSYFINVSRGKLVVTDDLFAALESNHLAGAGLDVTDPEPLPVEHKMWSLPNVIITAHIAGRGQYSWQRSIDVFITNVERYIKNLPLLNTVDKDAGF